MITYPRLVVAAVGCALASWAFLTQSANFTAEAEEVGLISLSGDGKAGPVCSDGHMLAEALRLAEDAVAEKLWSPATAKFAPTMNRVSRVSDCRYTIRSWVEAENSFGHMVRTAFVVELGRSEDGWVARGTRIGSPTYIEGLQLSALN